MSEKKPFGLVTDPDTGEQGYDEMQPGGLCHYDGPEAALPVGGYSAIPGWGPELIASRWQVLADGELVEKKTKELETLPPNAVICGVEINQDILKMHISTYGEGFYKLREANGGPLMTAAEWRARFGTDGLGLLAIRNIRQRLAGKRKIITI